MKPVPPPNPAAGASPLAVTAASAPARSGEEAPSAPPEAGDARPRCQSRRASRRWFLRVLGLGATGALGGAAYARFVEPRWLAVERHEVPLGLASGTPLRLLQLSDLHASAEVPLDFIARAVALGLAERPDLVCLTGDFVTHQFGDLQGYAKILARLSQSAPAFACLGNHDGGNWVASRGGYPTTREVAGLLAAGRVELLHNRARRVTVAGQELRLVGLGDWWADDMEPDAAFAGVPAEPRRPTLLLSHNPDTKDHLSGHRWDLMLSGHTHGGQFRAPLLGAPFAPVRDKRYVAGLHRWRDHWLHITRGVGNLHHLRFNCRPEVSLLTLR